MTKSSSSPITNETSANPDWYKIACKIRHQNRELKVQISQLEKILSQQQQQINEQIVKREQQDTVIQKQEQKINSLKAELTKQSNQVESTNKVEEKQQLLIETLSQELQEAQQQAAHLERECSFLQDKYDQQEHLLKQKEKENRELQVRLQRQQRYNLQYKTALDKYLQSNIAVNTTSPDNLSTQSENQIIKPWNQGQDQDKFESNSEKINPEFLTNLEDTVLQSETQIQDKINKDIPELIYEDNALSNTEATIAKLIEEIDEKREKIMSPPTLSQTPHKKLNLPKITSKGNKVIESKEGELNHQPKSNNNNKHQGAKKFLRLPKFGQRKQK